MTGDGPQFQFRGVWTPAHVLLLLKEGKLSPYEMVFLSIVDGLCEARGRGCWATNRYLGDMIGLKIRAVQNMISKLSRLGLIIVSDDGGQRILEVSWNGADPMHGDAPPHARRCMGHSSFLRSKKDSLDSIDDINHFSGTSTVATFSQSKAKVGKATAFDEQAADRLHTIVVESRKVYRQWSRSKWADTFRLLREELAGGAERITQVLEWYAQNTKRKGAPTISNATDFRKRFDWLEDLLQKDVGPVVLITDDAKAVAKRVLMRTWGKNTREQVLQVVQLSLTAADVLRSRRQVIHKTCLVTEPNSIYVMFLKHLATRIGDPKHFVEQWMYAVHDQVAKWQAWNGDLYAQAMSLDSKRLDTMGKQWATAFASDARLWTRFLKEVRGCE